MDSIYLRPLRVEDALVSYKWRNDAEIWKYTESRPDKVITPEIETEWATRAVADSSRKNYAICRVADNSYIGNIYLIHIAEEQGELGIFIGDRCCHGKGYGSQALEALKIIAKNDLGLKKILIDVDESNLPAMRTYEKCGAVRVECPSKKLKPGRILQEISL